MMVPLTKILIRFYTQAILVICLQLFFKISRKTEWIKAQGISNECLIHPIPKAD